MEKCSPLLELDPACSAGVRQVRTVQEESGETLRIVVQNMFSLMSKCALGFIHKGLSHVL